MSGGPHFSMPFGAELRPDGVAFRLWAPSQPAAAVVVDGLERPLERREDGWFERVVAEARAGSRYAFSFPGVDLRVPDPASRYQPDGAHGASQVIDPGTYSWRQTGWRGRPWHEIVLYELHLGTFTAQGTYAAAAARLPDLAELGVTAVELMPLAQPAGARNWGYDGVLPFAPQHVYGRPDDLKAFIDAAHALGLAVFLDVVYNHFGPEGNYLHLLAEPFFTDRHRTPWGAAIDVEGERAGTVREFFVQNALYWLREYRFDGLRLDAVHEIHDGSPRPFLDELAARVRAAAGPERHVHLVLENDANQARWLDRYDAQWNDDAHHALHVLLTGERDGYYGDYARQPARLLARALAEGFAYQGEPSPHRGGAARGEVSAGLPPTAFVDFAQNHDQIGNRAFGERISALAPLAAVHAAAAVLLLAPAIPLLFMGEEWAASTPFLFFSDFGPELATAVTEGRRREFAAWRAFSRSGRARAHPRPARPGHHARLGAALGRARHTAARPNAGAVPRAAGAAPRHDRAAVGAGPGRRRLRRAGADRADGALARRRRQPAGAGGQPRPAAGARLVRGGRPAHLRPRRGTGPARRRGAAAVERRLVPRGRPVTPRATYRLQLHAGFRFADATALVPYLARLGVSHVYASPYLKARPGSTHGYDIVDHNQLNPEMGSDDDYADFVAALRGHGMGHIVDFVPNHMGVGGDDNAWWLDLLAWGEESHYSDYFDIDWRPLRAELRGKVLLPFLGDQYGDILDAGELRWEYAEGGFALRYYEHRLPLTPPSYGLLLERCRAGLAGLVRTALRGAGQPARTGRQARGGGRAAPAAGRDRGPGGARAGGAAGRCAQHAGRQGADRARGRAPALAPDLVEGRRRGDQLPPLLQRQQPGRDADGERQLLR